MTVERVDKDAWITENVVIRQVWTSFWILLKNVLLAPKRHLIYMLLSDEIVQYCLDEIQKIGNVSSYQNTREISLPIS